MNVDDNFWYFVNFLNVQIEILVEELDIKKMFLWFCFLVQTTYNRVRKLSQYMYLNFFGPFGEWNFKLIKLWVNWWIFHAHNMFLCFFLFWFRVTVLITYKKKTSRMWKNVTLKYWFDAVFPLFFFFFTPCIIFYYFSHRFWNALNWSTI